MIPLWVTTVFTGLFLIIGMLLVFWGCIELLWQLLARILKGMQLYNLFISFVYERVRKKSVVSPRVND